MPTPASTREGSRSLPRRLLPLRLALGYVYFHFGVLKLFGDLSSAELLAGHTVAVVSFGWLQVRTAIYVLGIVEMLIGLGFLLGVWRRLVLAAFSVHLVGTMLPLLLFPELTFKVAPLAPNFAGQYILKNVVFAAAAWTVYAEDLGLAWPRRTAR
ncbi:MAG: DUF417 family protein [Polyangiaceae bacterium]